MDKSFLTLRGTGDIKFCPVHSLPAHQLQLFPESLQIFLLLSFVKPESLGLYIFIVISMVHLTSGPHIAQMISRYVVYFFKDKTHPWALYADCLPREIFYLLTYHHF